MAYRSDYYDTEEYADAPETNCEVCGELFEDCTCPRPLVEDDRDEGQPADIWDAYKESGDEKDLPF